MKKKAVATDTAAGRREHLDQLIAAVALVMVRRQMKRYWAWR